MTDKWTGLGLGYGFLEYSNVTDAHNAIEKMNGFKYVSLSLSLSPFLSPFLSFFPSFLFFPLTLLLFYVRVQGKALKVSVSRPSCAAITNANLYIKVSE